MLLIMLPEFAPQMYVSSAKYFSGKTLLRLRTENKPKAVNADHLKKNVHLLIEEIHGHLFRQ